MPIDISETNDYPASFIDMHFEAFVDYSLEMKLLHPGVLSYIKCVCGDILMCNLENVDLYADKLKNNSKMDTFEEKVYKLYKMNN